MSADLRCLVVEDFVYGYVLNVVVNYLCVNGFHVLLDGFVCYGLRVCVYVDGVVVVVKYGWFAVSLVKWLGCEFVQWVVWMLSLHS